MIGILEGKYHYRGIDILRFDLDPYGSFTKAVLSEGEKRVVLKVCDDVYTKITYDQDQTIIETTTPKDENGNTYDHIPLVISEEAGELEILVGMNSKNLSTPKTQ